MVNSLNIQHRPLTDLIPYARNSRTHSDAQVAQIAASIREFGWTNPILVDGKNGIIAGHGRVLAARKLGLAEVPIIELAQLTEAQRKAYIIADNKLALNAGWDDEMLGLELGELGDMGFDLGLTGFGTDELANLMPMELDEPGYPELGGDKTHTVTIRYTDGDERALKAFIGQDDDKPLEPTSGGRRILERIKELTPGAG